MTNWKLRLGSKKVDVGDPGRFLRAKKPQTQIDSGGTKNTYSWDGQEIDRDDLRKVKEIRESGGLVCWLFDVKSTMRFGTGAELQTEEDDLEEELNDHLFQNLDLTVLELGRDATWYPYGIAEYRESRSGGFHSLEFIEPWTMLPVTDEFGDVLSWEQKTQHSRQTRPVDLEEVGYITLNKSSGRDNIGISEVLRNEEEITQYKENQQAVNNALEVAAYPHHVWKVGAEGRTPVNDNDLRRVRNLIDNMDGDTQFVMGPDVNHDQITPTDFDFEAITKRDLRVLTTSVGLPMELAGYGREGMGSGSESRLIMDMLALQNEVARRQFETQFVEEFVRPVVERYTEFDPDQRINLQINPFLKDDDNMASLISQVGEYMSTAEVRERLDLPPLEDEEKAESFRSPQQIEEAEEGDQQDDGLDQIFNQKVETALESRDLEQLRTLQDNFDATLFELVATEEQDDFETGERLGIGVEFPNSGVYVDWNIEAWPEDDRLDGPHVSDYATLDDAEKVAQGELRELEAAELGDSGNVQLAGSDTPEWDTHYLSMLENTAWAENSKTLIAASEVPQMVQNRIRDSILGGSLFSEIDAIPSSERNQLREYMLETLTQDGWTTDGLADQIEQLGVDRDRAETIARTETASIVNSAREDAYESRDLEESKFKWVGTSDQRTTEACTWLKEQTNPKFGGTPVTLAKLKELIAEAPEHDPDMQDNLARPEQYTCHINERHTFVRHVE